MKSQVEIKVRRECPRCKGTGLQAAKVYCKICIGTGYVETVISIKELKKLLGI